VIVALKAVHDPREFGIVEKGLNFAPGAEGERLSQNAGNGRANGGAAARAGNSEGELCRRHDLSIAKGADSHKPWGQKFG